MMPHGLTSNEWSNGGTRNSAPDPLSSPRVSHSRAWSFPEPPPVRNRQRIDGYATLRHRQPAAHDGRCNFLEDWSCEPAEATNRYHVVRSESERTGFDEALEAFDGHLVDTHFEQRLFRRLPRQRRAPCDH